MSARVRPPFVLAYAADQQGCGLHRIAMPLMSMVTAGVADGRIDLQMWPVEMVTAAQPDTVVFQRWMEPQQVAAMQAVRAALPGTLLVYELDDYLEKIPDSSFHAGFMPPNLTEKIKAACLVCDRVTTSTEPLAQWFREEIGHPDVRVVGNAVPAEAIRPRAMYKDKRLRIGFVGGISHDGDLELIRPAMERIGDQVQWVFFGAKPRNAPAHIEFHPGVSPHEYQMRMLALDYDLLLAPLETGYRFNECKSNLRVIEAGMCGAACIAQRATPYLDAPVFRFADTPGDWTEAILDFIAAPMIDRQLSADGLLDWVRRNHTLEGRLPARLDAWLRDPSWQPKPVAQRLDQTVLALPQPEPVPRWARHAPRQSSLADACNRAGASGSDVLWLRPGTAMSEAAWQSLRSALHQAENIASVVPLAADGPNAFPRANNWTPVKPVTALAISDVLHKTLAGRKLIIAAPSGPCTLLSARALAAFGHPDTDGCDGNEEQAILEWGLRAAQRGWKNMQAADAYAASLNPPMQPTPQSAQRLQLRGYAQGGFDGETLLPGERASAELSFLKLQWTGPQPGTAGFGHDYASWAALVGDLPEPGPDALNASVSTVAFGTPAESLVSDEWFVFVDKSLHWHPNGFATLRAALANAPAHAQVVYADNAYRTSGGETYPDLKPDFDLELFLARDYVTPVCAIRGCWVSLSAIDSHADIYAVVLHIAERQGSKAVHHVREILATVDEPTPENVAVATIARQMVIEREYGAAVSVSAFPHLSGCLSVVRHWDVNERGERTHGNEHRPLVSIIIPTLGEGRLIQPCVNTLRQLTRYPNYEILVVQNGTDRAEPELNDAALADPRVRVIHLRSDGPFNWSDLNNTAAMHAEGRYLCFMNDDVCTGSEHWLDAMMGHAMRPDVGAVGARLVHPAGVIQHVGVVAHHGVAGHIFKGLPNGNPGNGYLAMLTHEAAAVTGACMLVSRYNFERVSGFDADSFPLNYSDTDFCLKLQAEGLRNVVEMTAEMMHAEGTSRSSNVDYQTLIRQLQEDNYRFARTWPQEDRYWHPHLSLGLAQGGLSISGLNRELLLWPERKPGPGAVRVLLINDKPGLAGQTVERQRRGEIVFVADVSDFTLRLIAPVAASITGWDIRKPSDLAADLRRLGIDRIVLRSLVGGTCAAAPVETLRCLARLGLPVDTDPVDPAVLTPWLVESPPEMFESTDIIAWRAAYETLKSREKEAA